MKREWFLRMCDQRYTVTDGVPPLSLHCVLGISGILQGILGGGAILMKKGN